MVWPGYFTVGGNEVGNSARTLGYTRTADCPITWLRDRDCGGLNDAVDDEPYIYERIDEAPWYDPDNPELTSRFYGLYIVEMQGVNDSTRQASVTEMIIDGAQVSGYRHTSREVRVRAVLSANGMDALDSGMTWLRNVLEPNACGVHGGDCGASDMQFFVDCPPPIGDLTEEEYQEEVVDPLYRILHQVTCISGPLVQQELASNDGTHFGYIVEFTLLAAVPFVYAKTREIVLPPISPTVISDVAYNLITRPSAELNDGASVLFATNYSLNPSLETNTTGWSTSISGGSPDVTPFTTSARSNDVAAAGTWSYRVRVLGNGTGSTIGTDQEIRVYAPSVDLTGFASDTNISISIWAAAYILAGVNASEILEISADIDFVGFVGTPPPLTPTAVTNPAFFNGQVFSGASMEIPVGATAALVSVAFRFDWGSSSVAADNSDIRLYVDAHAVTVP